MLRNKTLFRIKFQDARFCHTVLLSILHQYCWPSSNSNGTIELGATCTIIWTLVEQVYWSSKIDEYHLLKLKLQFKHGVLVVQLFLRGQGQQRWTREKYCQTLQSSNFHSGTMFCFLVWIRHCTTHYYKSLSVQVCHELASIVAKVQSFIVHVTIAFGKYVQRNYVMVLLITIIG